MTSIWELRQEHKAALDAAESALGSKGHVMTTAESEQYDASMKKAAVLEGRIKARERVSTIRTAFPDGMPGIGAVDSESQAFMQPVSTPVSLALTRQPEYAKSLMAFLRTGGKAHDDELTAGADGQGGYHVPGSEQYTKQRLANGTFPKMSAAMYEGSGGSSDAAGGYAISIPTVEQIVPLAMPDLGIFDASMVIPTATDIKIPQQASFGTSVLKAESTARLLRSAGLTPRSVRSRCPRSWRALSGSRRGNCCRTYSSSNSSLWMIS